MPVTVNVVMEGLPGKEIAPMYPVPADQNMHLVALKDEVRLTMKEEFHMKEDQLRLTRHFWSNRMFQPYTDRDGRPRYVAHLGKAAAVDVQFAPNSYLVQMPSGKRQTIVLDAESTVEAALAEMQAQKMIRDVCCYEVLDSQQRPLDGKRKLWEQDALPYIDAKDRDSSLLTIRLQPSHRRRT